MHKVVVIATSLTLAASLNALADAPNATNTQKLVALQECPKTGPHRACMRLRFTDVSKDPEFAFEETERFSTRAVLKIALRGALAGSEPENVELTFAANGHAYPGHSSGSFDLPVAYLGRSIANRPIILTDQGPLEILSKAFDLGFGFPTLLIVEKGGRRTEYFDFGSIDFERDKYQVWTPANGGCVTTPQNTPGLLSFRASGCTQRGRADLKPDEEIRWPEVIKLAPYLALIETPIEPPVHGNFYTDAFCHIEVYRFSPSRHRAIFADCFAEGETEYLDP